MYGQQSAFPYAANPMAPYGQNRYNQFQPSFTARPQRPMINPLQNYFDKYPDVKELDFSI